MVVKISDNNVFYSINGKKKKKYVYIYISIHYNK